MSCKHDMPLCCISVIMLLQRDNNKETIVGPKFFLEKIHNLEVRRVSKFEILTNFMVNPLYNQSIKIDVRGLTKPLRNLAHLFRDYNAGRREDLPYMRERLESLIHSRILCHRNNIIMVLRRYTVLHKHFVETTRSITDNGSITKDYVMSTEGFSIVNTKTSAHSIFCVSENTYVCILVSQKTVAYVSVTRCRRKPQVQLFYVSDYLTKIITAEISSFVCMNLVFITTNLFVVCSINHKHLLFSVSVEFRLSLPRYVNFTGYKRTIS